jgi:hypothetical protein
MVVPHGPTTHGLQHFHILKPSHNIRFENRENVLPAFPIKRRSDSMMIYTAAFVLCALLSSTQAQPVFRSNAKGGKTLGSTFLTIAKNYTPSDDPPTGGTLIETRSGTFSLELEVTAIRPLADEFDLLCDQHGKVYSKSMSGNNTVTTSYSLGCRLTSDKYDVYEAAAIDLLEAAQDDSASYSYYSDTNSYWEGGYSSTDPNAAAAQQKALESLMAKANSVEEVMLVFSSWQYINTDSSFSYTSSSSGSTITVSLSQKYEYTEYPFAISGNDTNTDD